MEEWLLLRSGPGPAALNMAIDEALLLHVGQLAKPVLRFYAWSEPAASFGYFQRYAEVAETVPLRPLVRRPTGGGIVPHDCDWTYSVVVPPSHFWYQLKAVDSYRRVHEWIQRAFSEMGLAAELALERRQEAGSQCFVGAEQFDVVADKRKIAGAAQRRTRNGLLIQGSVQPPAGLKREQWEDAVCAWAATHRKVHWSQRPLSAEVVADAERLAREKYGNPKYNERR